MGEWAPEGASRAQIHRESHSSHIQAQIKENLAKRGALAHTNNGDLIGSLGQGENQLRSAVSSLVNACQAPPWHPPWWSRDWNINWWCRRTANSVKSSVINGSWTLHVLHQLLLCYTGNVSFELTSQYLWFMSCIQ